MDTFMTGIELVGIQTSGKVVRWWWIKLTANINFLPMQVVGDFILLLPNFTNTIPRSR